MSGTELILTRHAQTVWHAENRYAGVSDVDLTDLGRGQARALAVWTAVERPSAIACSPVRRAVETAAPSAKALGVRPEIVAGLRELNFGIAEGRTIGELEAAQPAVAAAFREDPIHGHFPGGEDPAAAAHRGAAALRALANDHVGHHVLVVAHNTLLRLALCQLLAIDLRMYRTVLPHMNSAALTHLAWPAGATAPPALLAFNVPLLDHVRRNPR